MTYFRQAKNYSKGRRGQKIRLLVIHTMECPEQNHRAEWCIDWMAGKGAPVASTHYAIDGDSYAQGVRDEDTAFASPPMSIQRSALQFEHACYAGQTASQWKDAYSLAMLEISARLVASKCQQYGIPPVHLTGDAIRTGKGITGHVDINRVYRASTHTDPGVNFPWTYYLSRVKHYLGVKPKKTVTSTPTVKNTDNKTISRLADEVLAGKHGAGEARRRSLGVNYAAVQNEVNRRLAARVSKPATVKTAGKTVAQMATEVIAGKHGNGHAQRQKSLGVSAATYSAVRAEVNRRLR